MKTILITGQTGLVTSKILEQLSGSFSIVLTSEEPDRTEDSCRVFHTKPGETSFGQVFRAHEFMAVWYISPWADMGEGVGARKELQEVYDQCRENHIRKLLVISSSQLTEEQRKEEEDVLFSSRQPDSRPILIRVPGIITDENQNTSLGRIFSGIYRRDRKIRIPEMQDGDYEYMPLSELVSLLKKITVSVPEAGIYQLAGEYVISREQLAGEVAAISKRSRLESDGRILPAAAESSSGQLSRKFSFFVRDQRQLEFQRLYEVYRAERRARSGRLSDSIRRLRGKAPEHLLKVLDIVLLFILAEFISKYTTEFVYFKEIDVRLIYIFLIATAHGLKAGVVASLAECVVLFYQYRMLGVYGLQLFYNVENWIPFVLCIVVGAVAGYFSDLKEDERRLVDQENALLREKYLFLNDMYNSTSEVRDEYRRQILTFDNSYGKIYDAIRQMNCDTIQEVCFQAQKILEKHLDNPSVCIYRWDPSRSQAGLLFCSEDFEREERELLVAGDRQALFEGLKGEGIYVNTMLDSRCPMYGAVHVPKAGSGGPEQDPVLLLVWDVLPEQMNDYYANQFEILSGLAGDALDRAALLQKASTAR